LQTITAANKIVYISNLSKIVKPNNKIRDDHFTCYFSYHLVIVCNIVADI